MDLWSHVRSHIAICTKQNILDAKRRDQSEACEAAATFSYIYMRIKALISAKAKNLLTIAK